MHWFLSLLLNCLALILADFLVDGFQVHGILAAGLAVIILGLVNGVVRPVLLFLTLPLTVITLGLFYFIVNAVTFYLTSWLVPGFYVYSFGGAFWGAIVTGLFNWLLNELFNKYDH